MDRLNLISEKYIAKTAARITSDKALEKMVSIKKSGRKERWTVNREASRALSRFLGVGFANQTDTNVIKFEGFFDSHPLTTLTKHVQKKLAEKYPAFYILALEKLLNASLRGGMNAPSWRNLDKTAYQTARRRQKQMLKEMFMRILNEDNSDAMQKGIPSRRHAAVVLREPAAPLPVTLSPNLSYYPRRGI